MKHPITSPILTLTLICLLAGCAVTTKDFQPPVQAPAAWSLTSTGTPLPDPLPEQWWSALADPDLDALVETAINNNFDLRTAWDRLAQAQAIARREGAALEPSLDLRAGAGRTRSRTTTATTANSSTRTDLDLDLGLGLSYELDLWGRLRNTRDAAALDALAAQDDVSSSAIILSADLATRWYEYSEQIERIAVLKEQNKRNQDVYDIINTQFRAGQTRAEDVLRQRNLVESNLGQLAIANRRAQTLRLQLLVLIGATPDQPLPIETPALIDLPALPDLGVPATLLQQRPDVRQAYRAVQAADQRAAAAITDRYPSISLSASASTSANRTADLFDNWLANLAANLTAPILDGGRRSAEIERTQAVTSQAINTYAQTILVALQEVETALAQEAQQREYLQSLERQHQTADLVVERIRDNYISGQTEYINVLNAQTTKQTLELQLLEAKRTLITDRIALSRALAGGWSMTPPEQARLEPIEESQPTIMSIDADQGPHHDQ